MKAELVFANVLDGRVYDSQGDGGPPLVYMVALPGRGLPFAVIRDWKAPQGHVAEHFQLIAPSGNAAYASEPRVRFMPGQMDLTRIVDVVRDAVFQELGVYVASFLIDGEVQGQIQFQILLQEVPEKLPKDVEDGLRKSDVIWVGIEANGRDRAVPVWFAYRQGRIYLLHTVEGKSGEQQIPGLPDTREAVVVTRHKYRDTRSQRFHASVRVIPPGTQEFEQLAALLADRRRDRHGSPQEAVDKWRQSCVIAELTPQIPA